MAGKLTATQGTGILLVTANVGSLFEDPVAVARDYMPDSPTRHGLSPRQLAVSQQVRFLKMTYRLIRLHTWVIAKDALMSPAFLHWSFIFLALI
ncbi:hypothetical protein FQN60_015262 [Etheostoma spectabile]|uniref:Uncharacterized protein n=1 Tax=Etheostoma spectabile TaxID=54343 RepID=A0A5J5CRV5_9PERO|nr:hypothetical protein FQN60_015262 [Etheostoma spectabile]